MRRRDWTWSGMTWGLALGLNFAHSASAEPTDVPSAECPQKTEVVCERNGTKFYASTPCACSDQGGKVAFADPRTPESGPEAPKEICFGKGCAALAGPSNLSVELESAPPASTLGPIRIPISPTPRVPAREFTWKSLDRPEVQVFCRWSSSLDCKEGKPCTALATCDRWSPAGGTLESARIRMTCEGTAKSLTEPTPCLRVKFPSGRIPASELLPSVE